MTDSLVARVVAGDRRALARLITRVENQTPDAAEALAQLYPHTGRAYIVGVTGAPGTGKSTVVNALAHTLRGREQTVGIVAVDPTSPFTGGAVLGDRIRMVDLAGDKGVFIRSMANRGSLGGLAATTGDVVRVLDAAGFDIVLIETVGAGQSEVDIARMAYTTIVVDAPGLGDDVQAIQAGILEIADGQIMEQDEHPPAGPDYDFWRVPILKTTATEGTGIDSLADAIEQHRAHLHESGLFEERARQRIESELGTRLREALLARLVAERSPDAVKAMIRRVTDLEIDPGSAVRALLDGEKA